MKVIVVGAGLSGLVSGLRLQEAGHDVVLLEARNRVGGRVHTVRDGFADGQYADVGAMILYEGQPNIIELCRRFELEVLAEARGAAQGNRARGTEDPVVAGPLLVLGPRSLRSAAPAIHCAAKD